ncbi:nuclease-related domain-containing protein [Paludicola sp. MB14-C6]|uniref:nuclease-related domain-containing protein n=1 Tax=Paludihabitans sp. MB14-C6 TaxID=3070656 RepID=UPI0027DACF84|nr:nuclease-related domain-containing protein [Paludicola sp. MB14-C6]WMJ23361.1 nuclease-related domain-containing protein [Paludicola sp. MB14-C6]
MNGYTYLWILGGIILILKILEEIFKSPNVTGAYGEYVTVKQLEKLTGYKKIIRNPIFITENESCEIDIIMIHETAIYVIESKNYSGWIFGKENQFKWTQCLKRKRKNSFYNPIMQNRKHIKVLADLLNIDTFQSVIVFSDRCELKKVEYNSNIILNKRTNAIRSIKYAVKNNPPILNEMQIDEFYNRIMQKAYFDKETRRKHIESIKAKQKD